MPGKYIPYDGTKDLTHLINVLHDGVNFLAVILSDILIAEGCPADGGSGGFIPQDNSEALESEEKPAGPKI